MLLSISLIVLYCLILIFFIIIFVILLFLLTYIPILILPLSTINIHIDRLLLLHLHKLLVFSLGRGQKLVIQFIVIFHVNIALRWVFRVHWSSDFPSCSNLWLVGTCLMNWLSICAGSYRLGKLWSRITAY
jgi:hypothetical protein